MLKPNAPCHQRTLLFSTSFHLKKMKAKNNERRPFSAFHFFSAPRSVLRITFTWVTVLNLLQQPNFLYLTSHGLATLLTLFRLHCSILSLAPGPSHSHVPSTVCSLYTITQHQQSRLAPRNLLWCALYQEAQWIYCNFDDCLLALYQALFLMLFYLFCI